MSPHTSKSTVRYCSLLFHQLLQMGWEQHLQHPTQQIYALALAFNPTTCFSGITIQGESLPLGRTKLYFWFNAFQIEVARSRAVSLPQVAQCTPSWKKTVFLLKSQNYYNAWIASLRAYLVNRSSAKQIWLQCTLSNSASSPFWGSGIWASSYDQQPRLKKRKNAELAPFWNETFREALNSATNAVWVRVPETNGSFCNLCTETQNLMQWIKFLFFSLALVQIFPLIFTFSCTIKMGIPSSSPADNHYRLWILLSTFTSKWSPYVHKPLRDQ